MVERPGFTAPPFWEHRKYEGLIVVGEREYKTRRFLDIRMWVGEYGEKATKVGVTVPIKAVPDLARALTAYAANLSPTEPDFGS